MTDIGRNDPCPCGSGKKYKKCCEAKDASKRSAENEKQLKQQQKEFEKQKAEGITCRLVAFELKDRGVPRHGYDCYSGGAKVGHVTSGTHTPFLEKPLGMAYLPLALAEPGKTFEVDLRGRKAAAVVVSKPFYKREKR